MNIRLSRIFLGLLVLALLKLGLMFGLKSEPVARMLTGLTAPAAMETGEAEAAQQGDQSQKPDAKAKKSKSKKTGEKKPDEAKPQAEAAPAPAPAAPAQADSPLSPASAQAQTPPPASNATKAPPVGNPAENDWNALKRREEELTRREQALKTLEGDLDIKLAKLAATERSIKKMLDDANVLKDEKIKHLVSVYAAMKAKQAASVIETLDEDLAVKILSGMRGQQAGEILTFVNPKKAASLSEALTRLQIPFGK